MFKFREIREIKPNETRKEQTQKKEGFKKIKTETDMTIEEAKRFVEELFRNGGEF